MSEQEEKKLLPPYVWTDYKNFNLFIRPDERHGKEALYCECIETPDTFSLLNDMRCHKRRSFNFHDLNELKNFVNALTLAIREFENHGKNT
jgi:hypothetical protein